LILIDTSAWVEFLRDTDSLVCRRVDKVLSQKIAICDAVRMEVLAGARDDGHLNRLRQLLARATILPTESIDYDAAAALYRTGRRQGKTIRKPIDCLIAAVALRANVPILHMDADFDALATISKLRIETLG
jgi:predicted nucleic acid-binding protein